MAVRIPYCGKRSKTLCFNEVLLVAGTRRPRFKGINISRQISDPIFICGINLEQAAKPVTIFELIAGLVATYRQLADFKRP